MDLWQRQFSRGRGRISKRLERLIDAIGTQILQKLKNWYGFVPEAIDIHSGIVRWIVSQTVEPLAHEDHRSSPVAVSQVVQPNGYLQNSLIKLLFRFHCLYPQGFQCVVTGVELTLIKRVYPKPKLIRQCFHSIQALSDRSRLSERCLELKLQWFRGVNHQPHNATIDQGGLSVCLPGW